MSRLNRVLHVTLRYFTEDWDEVEVLRQERVPFDAAILLIEEFRDEHQGPQLRCELSEESGMDVAVVTGEVILG